MARKQVNLAINKTHAHTYRTHLTLSILCLFSCRCEESLGANLVDKRKLQREEDRERLTETGSTISQSTRELEIPTGWQLFEGSA